MHLLDVALNFPESLLGKKSDRPEDTFWVLCISDTFIFVKDDSGFYFPAAVDRGSGECDLICLEVAVRLKLN